MSVVYWQARWRAALFLYLFTTGTVTGAAAAAAETTAAEESAAEAAGVYMTGEPSDAAAAPGARVLLACAARVTPPAPPATSPAPDVRYTWRYAAGAGEPLAELLLADEDPASARRQLPNGSLVLPAVSAAEAGRYRCAAAADGIGTVVSRVATVSLVELPPLSADSPEAARRVVAVWRGAVALLPCAAAAAAAGGARAAYRVLGATAGADRRVYGVAQHLQPSVPTVDLNVRWLRDGVPLTLAAERMSLTPSGALELEPAREHDAAVYRCNVSLAHAPHVHRVGPDTELVVASEAAAPDAAPRFVAAPQPLTVMEGSAVTFDCAAVGEPRPEMIWLNNGVAIDLNDLDSRFYLVGAGSLRVLSVRALDAGTYTCRATNRHDSADRTTQLSVLTSPRVTRVRTAVAARARGDALLPCEARGRPPPAVVWLKDGEPVTPNHDITIVNGASLRIQGVLSVDAGMFQCVASSPAGSAQAATRLLVLPPLHADDLLKKVPKKSTKLKSNSSGRGKAPAPVSGDRAPIDPRSFLNSLRSSGNTELPFTLEDISRKAAPANPRLRPRPHLDSHHILTTLLSDEDLPPTIDDEDDSGHELGSPGDSAELEFDSPDALGETSSAFTLGPDVHSHPEHWEESENDAEGNTLTDVWSPDGAATVAGGEGAAPRGLRAVIVKHRFVTLSWDAPPSSDDVVAYAVVYRVKGSERERVLRTERAVQEMNVASLLPDTDYQFRVVAYTRPAGAAPAAAAVASQPSESVEVRTPAEEWARGAPRDVRAEGAGPAALRVLWAPPADAAPTDKYRLQWTEVESGREQYAWSAAGATEHVIGGLRAATLYAVRVSAAAGGAPSPEVRARTLQDAPAAPPANVTAAPHTSTSILVRWEAPPARSHRGPLTGYKIRYRLAAPPSAATGPAAARRRADSLTTPADARRAELRRLERATAYQVRVCALNANGSGPFSDWVTVETAPQELDESRVPTEPGPLRTRAGRDWISVWWSAAGEAGAGAAGVAGEVGGGGGGGVRVRNYSLAWGLGVPDEHSHVLPDDARSHVVRDLQSNSEYVVSLRASNSLGSGPPVYATVRTRAPLAAGDDDDDDDELAGGGGGGAWGGGDGDGDGDGDGEEGEDEAPALIPPVGLKAIMLSGTTAVVYWTDTTLPKGQTATDGRRYVVQWSAPGGGGGGSGGGGGRARYFNATDLNCMIDELRPHTTYEFAVKLIKGGRESAWSMVVSNTSLEAAPSSAPRDLSLANAPPVGRALDLVWAPPAKPNGIITGYIIMYCPEPRRSERECVATAVAGERRAHRLDRLRPRTTYHFKLQARNSKGLGPFSQPVAFTTPDESSNGGAMETGATNGGAWLWACAGGALAVLAVAAALALSLCCRRDRHRPPLSPDQSTYQKASASVGIKPPDLWIHHDQMELKQLDKSHHSSSISAGSADNALVSSTLTLGRHHAPPGDYEPARHHAPPVGSVDRRHYVPTYVDSRTPPPPPSIASDDTVIMRAGSVASGASSGLSCRPYDFYDCKPMSSVSGMGAGGGGGGGGAGYSRPPHPRPLHAHIDQSTPLLGGGGGALPSPQSSLGSLAPLHAPHHAHTHAHAHLLAHAHAHQHQHQHQHQPPPCTVAGCPLGAACGAAAAGAGGAGTPLGDLYAVASRERERGHYVAYEPLGHYTHRDSVSEASGSVGGSLQRRAGAAGAGGGALHSFTLPAGAAGAGAGAAETHSAQHSQHSTPSHGKVTVRSNTSPYKKSSSGATSSCGSPSARLLSSPHPHPHALPLPPPPHTSAAADVDELEPLTPSRSTERLQREMANLEGLMKDLSAITQQQFQC